MRFVTSPYPGQGMATTTAAVPLLLPTLLPDRRDRGDVCASVRARARARALTHRFSCRLSPEEDDKAPGEDRNVVTAVIAVMAAMTAAAAPRHSSPGVDRR